MTGGTTGFISRLEVVKGDANVELEPTVTVGRALEALFGIRLGDNLEGNVADCLVGTVDRSANGGGMLEVKLGKPVPTVGSMGLENSAKFDALPGKDVFVVGFCI